MKKENVLQIVTDYIPMGSIKLLLQETGPLPKNLIKNYTKQMLHALVYIHSLGKPLFHFC